MEASGFNKRPVEPGDDEELQAGQKKQKAEGTQHKGVVSDNDIWDVAHRTNLCHADFQNIFLKLGISSSNVERAEYMADSKDVKLRAIKVLRFWRQTRGSNATRETLIQTLHECNLTDAREILEKKWTNRSQVSEKYQSKATESELLSSQVLNVDLKGYRPDVITWQRQLKAIYKKNRGGIGFIPGLPKQFASDEFFVELKLMKEQKKPMEVKHIKIETYTDLLKLQNKQGISLNHVLVSGLAGTGKTTLISRLAYQWATSNEGISACKHSTSSCNPQSLSNLDDFELVFALDIRKFDVNQDLVGAITKQLLHDVSRSDLGHYISVNAIRCLFLFDGYDELGSNDTILREHRLCGCQSIVTTRPNKLDDFNSCYVGYVHVVLEGFSDKGIETFVSSFVCRLDQDSESGQRKEYESIFAELNKNSTIKILSHFPLMLAMMCVLWQQNHSLPDTISSLYQKVVEFLGRHWMNRKQSKGSFTDFKNQTAFDELLTTLGRTALESLVDQDSKLIFQEDDFDSSNIVDHGCSLGLITKHCTVSGFDQVTSVSFIHKTFQEYCAAMYLTSLFETEQGRSLCRSYLSKMNLLDMEYVLTFSCGVNASAAKFVLSHVINMSCESKHILECSGKEFGCWGQTSTDPWRIPLILLFEAESQFGFDGSLHALLKPLVTSMFICQAPRSTTKNRREYHNILKYFADDCRSPCKKWLTFVRNVTIYIMIPIRFNDTLTVELLGKAPGVTSLTMAYRARGRPKHYHIDCTDLLEQIKSTMTGTSIKVLEFDRCYCQTSAIKSFLYSQANLNILQIPLPPANGTTEIKILEEIFQEVSARSGSVTTLCLRVHGPNVRQFIPIMCRYVNVLKYLAMSDTDATPSEFESLFEALHKAGRKQDDPGQEYQNLPLNHLDLRCANIGDSSYKLAEATTHLGLLEYLNLSSCKLDAKHFHVLGPAFARLTNLSELDLLGNMIGNSFPSIAQGISQCKLSKLVLKGIGSGCVQGIPVSLRNMSKLEQLDLSKNNIASISIENMPKLKRLSLYKSHIQTVSLQDTHQLETLSLGYNNIGSSDVQALSVSLQSTPKLTELALYNNSIRSDGAKVLSTSLRCTLRLNKLDLSNNNIGSDGAKAISSSLQYNNQLSELHLANNKIGQDGAKALASSFQYIPNLIELNLAKNHIGSDGAKAMSASLKCIPGLISLYLSDNTIGPDGDQALLASLQSMPSLIELYLTNNNIGADGARALSESFQYFKQFTCLHLSNNNIGSEGAVALSASLIYIPLLRQLTLSNNDIGSIGADALSTAFQNMPDEHDLYTNRLVPHKSPIQRLELSNNSIGSDGAQALSASFRYLPRLSRLDLSNNSISSDGAESIAESFQYTKSLSSITLDQNPMSYDGVAAIFEHLHHLQSLTFLGLKQISGDINKPRPLLQACIKALRESGTWEDVSEEYWCDLELRSDEISLVKKAVKDV